MNTSVRSELRKQRSVRLSAIALRSRRRLGALTASLITTAGHGSNPPLHRGSLTELVHAPYAIVAGAALLPASSALPGVPPPDDHRHPARLPAAVGS